MHAICFVTSHSPGRRECVYIGTQVPRWTESWRNLISFLGEVSCEIEFNLLAEENLEPRFHSSSSIYPLPPSPKSFLILSPRRAEQRPNAQFKPSLILPCECDAPRLSYLTSTLRNWRHLTLFPNQVSTNVFLSPSSPRMAHHFHIREQLVVVGRGF